ncbi:MAG: hypothetical protein ACR2IJ_08525 [Fluviibacter sp.]
MTINSIFTTLNQSLWVWLATDVLLWMLFVLFVLSVVLIVRSPLQRAVWQKVFRQRLAVVSAVLLAVAACFALLDSIHLREPLPRPTPEAPVRYSVEVNSVLDLLLVELRSDHEKTYSAPLAITLAALEPVTIALPDGTVEVRREAPRLKVAGAAFGPGPVDDMTYWLDVLQRVGVGALGGAMFFAVFCFLFLLLTRTLSRQQMRNQVAWRRAAYTLGSVCVIGGIFVG